MNDEVVDCIQVDRINNILELYDNNTIDEFVNEAIAFAVNHITNIKVSDGLFKLLKKCLHCAHVSTRVYETKYHEILNLFGILCYYNGEIDSAINIYLLGTLNAKGADRWNYYHNLGDAYGVLGNFKFADYYFQVSIEGIRNEKMDPEETEKWIAHYKISQIECLLRIGEINRANEILVTIDSDHLRKEHKLSSHRVVNALILLNESRLTYEEATGMKTEMLEQKNIFSCIELNIFLLRYYSPISVQQQEELLIENVKLSNYLSNVEIKKKARVELIDFYILHKNEKMELEILRGLYNLISSENNETKNKYTTVYLKEISFFINKLKDKNILISTQKTELEELTYILSHDLKTPLRTIVSFSELLKLKLKDHLNSEHEEFIDYIISSGKNLYSLIEDVNMIHKIKIENGISKRIDLNQTIEKITQLFNIDNKVKVLNPLPVVLGNPSNYFILFSNLIENGLKYNNSSSPLVTISCKQIGMLYQLTFQDNGIGISPEYHDYIFQYFKRLNSKDEYEGTGFGLGICKKVITMLNGKIAVESTLGKGSKFIVSFPIRSEITPAKVTQSEDNVLSLIDYE